MTEIYFQLHLLLLQGEKKKKKHTDRIRPWWIDCYHWEFSLLKSPPPFLFPPTYTSKHRFTVLMTSRRADRVCSRSHLRILYTACFSSSSLQEWETWPSREKQQDTGTGSSSRASDLWTCCDAVCFNVSYEGSIAPTHIPASVTLCVKSNWQTEAIYRRFVDAHLLDFFSPNLICICNFHLGLYIY